MEHYLLISMLTWMDEEGRFYEVSKTVVEAPAQ